MTGDVVNLRARRKAKARAERGAKAAENRAMFGQSRTERQRAQIERDRARRHHDGHRLEGETDERRR